MSCTECLLPDTLPFMAAADRQTLKHIQTIRLLIVRRVDQGFGLSSPPQNRLSICLFIGETEAANAAAVRSPGGLNPPGLNAIRRLTARQGELRQVQGPTALLSGTLSDAWLDDCCRLRTTDTTVDFQRPSQTTAEASTSFDRLPQSLINCHHVDSLMS